MRIAMISEHASPLAGAGGVDSGGQNVYVAEVARCLCEAGHRVDVYTRRDDPALPRAVPLASGARVLHVDAGPPRFVPKEELLPHMPAFAESMAGHWPSGSQAAAVRPYDVVHANFFMSGLVGLALQQRIGTPLLTSFHALGLVRREHQKQADRFPPERIAIERELVRRSDRIIAACPQDEADLVRLYGASPSRLTQVPCGVDVSALRPGDRAEARARLGLPAAEFIVLQLGRLVPRKGIANVVRALALLPDGGRLVVVGGDADTPDETATPEIGRLRRIARQAGVAERVQFTGRRGRAELRDWYVAADVFVTTPWYEPFGITPLEAMACGTPVIGSAVGGIAFTVQHGRTGFLVPPEDPQALARRLLLLQRQPALAAAMGQAGVQRVRSQFTWEQVAAQLALAYADVLRQAAVPTPAMREEGTPAAAVSVGAP